jgi:antirestriction protein ArdC
MASKVVEIVTNKVIEYLENGKVPWEKGWKDLGTPTNVVSKKPYRGFNSFVLGLFNHADPRFLTYKQARDLGGFVKTGEKGIPIVFWNFTEEEKVDGSKEKSAFMRYYTVFNVSQCDGLTLEPLEALKEIETSLEAEKVVEGYRGKPRIVEGGDKAFYSPSMDYVQVPLKAQFKTKEDYYGTLYHELVHSTGHEDRLKRFKNENAPARFGDEAYSKEELVAEIGSAILCEKSGIEKNIENTATYIAGWLEALKKDRSLIIKAVSQAEKASNFILGIKETEKA